MIPRVLGLAAALCVLAAAGSAQAGSALYTPVLASGSYTCTALNVSKKPVTVTIEIFEAYANSGTPEDTLGPVSLPAGIAASLDCGACSGDSVYCKITVKGGKKKVRGVLHNADMSVEAR